MPKIFIFLFLSSILLFSQETEEFPFIGVTTSFNTTDILTPTSTIEQLETTNIGIRYGQQTVDWRSMITYNRSTEQKQLSVEIDKILLDEMFGTSILRPYLGLTLGMLTTSNSNVIDETSYFYGFNAGLIVYATDNVDVDVSFHYNETFDEDAIANMQGGTMAVHYFY